MQKIIKVPSNWPFEHIPVWEYDGDNELEVSNFMCGECIHHHDGLCKCIDHKYVHFFRPWFSCDVGTSHHTICKAFEPHPDLYPAGYVEWQYLEGFDEWYRIWIKQWHNGRNPPWGSVQLIRASHTEGREHSDDRYSISYGDFLNCEIMKSDGVHCLDYAHIERTRKSITGYVWVHEGPGLWIPWENDTYKKVAK